MEETEKTSNRKKHHIKKRIRIKRKNKKYSFKKYLSYAVDIILILMIILFIIFLVYEKNTTY